MELKSMYLADEGSTGRDQDQTQKDFVDLDLILMKGVECISGLTRKDRINMAFSKRYGPPKTLK